LGLVFVRILTVQTPGKQSQFDQNKIFTSGSLRRLSQAAVVRGNKRPLL